MQALSPSQPRVISIENSHSWLKRHDDEGTLVIQAGWRNNPSRNAHRDDENPLVVYPDKSVRWYGAIACMGAHESALTHRKDSTAKHALGALLRPSDDGRDLVVVTSHWDSATATRIAQSLQGPISITRNGYQIRSRVIQAVPVREGMGTYWLLRRERQLKPGLTLIFEFGFGTCEWWMVDESGRSLNGDAIDSLAVFQLCNAIAQDSDVQHALKSSSDSEQAINISLVSAALRGGSLGKLNPLQWENIKRRYVRQWTQSVQGHILKNHAADTQAVSNIVFTGGGAELLKDWAKAIAIIPSQPQTASVRGAYHRHMATTKGATHAA